jgi:predicted dehydrogenase
MGGAVRWGILGTGKIARILAGAVAASEGGELVSVGSREGARSEAFATEFGIRRHHPTYDGLIEDDQVDLVYVATHHPQHRASAVRAADAGKHVLCEKPLAVRHADAAEIVDAARRNDVFLLEAFAYRTHPQTHRVVELLRAGAIGEPRFVDAVFGYDAGPSPGNYLLRPELAGGGVLDVGCYTTSMAHLVAAAAGGSVVEAVEVAGAAAFDAGGVDLTTAVTVVFESGVLARLACSIQANLESSVRIVGSEGRMTVPSPWLPGRIGTGARIALETWGGGAQMIDVPSDPDIYAVEVDAVNSLVHAGVRNPSVMTWEESLANMRTLDRWRDAIGLRYPALEDRAERSI